MLVLTFLLVFSSFQHASIVIAEGIDDLQDELDKVEEVVSSEENGKSELETAEEDREEEILEVEANEEEHEENEPLAQAEEKEQSEEVKEDHSESIDEDSLPQTSLNDQGSVEITENIISSVQLFHINENGELVDVPQPMPHPSEQVLDLALHYSWELRDQSPSNHGYFAGSTYEFQLPDVFQVYNEVSGDLLDGSGLSYGTYELDMNRNVTMTFNENIEGRFNVNGTLEFRTVIREDLTGDLDQTITIDIRDDDVVRIPISFESNIGSTIDKSGIPNRSYNADFIKWQVDFNKSLNTITNAVLCEPIQAGQEANLVSIRLFELKVDLEGNVTLGEEVNPKSGLYEIRRNDDGFDVVFKEQIDSAYRLVFETAITDDDEQDFGNIATLTGDEISEMPAEAWVWTGRGQPLDKRYTDYDGSTQTITWEIKLNYNERTLSEEDSLVRDLFDNAHEFVDDSLKVYEVEIDENGQEVQANEMSDTDYLLTPISVDDKNGFELRFYGGIDKAIKVVYQTKSVERVFDYETISNTVEFTDKDKTADRDVWQQILSKWHENVNYHDKTVDWVIVVNSDHYVMDQLVLTDTFTNKGLTLMGGTLTIDELDESQYEVMEVEDGFVIHFKERIDKRITVRYTTEFDYGQRENKEWNYFLNDVHLEWIDEDGKKQEKEGSYKFEPDRYTQANGFKGGSYNAITKEITWTIGVNYNLRDIEEARVVDYILGDQTLIEDSIKVYHGQIGQNGNHFVKDGEPLIEGDDYIVNLDIKDTKGNAGFSVDLFFIDNRSLLSTKQHWRIELLSLRIKTRLICSIKQTNWRSWMQV